MVVGLCDTKMQIVEILTNIKTASPKQIYAEVRNHQQLSYQAVHKSIKVLCEYGILTKEKSLYGLCPDWIVRMSQLSERLNATYIANNPEQLQHRLDQDEVALFRFSRAIEMWRFFLNCFLSLPNTTTQPTVCRWRRMYCIMGLSEEEVSKMQLSMSQTPHYIACNSVTSFDTALKNHYSQWGALVRLGVDCAKHHDTFVRGEWVAQTVAPRRYHAAWDSVHQRTQKLQQLDLNTIFKLMHKVEYDLKVIVIKSLSHADSIRKRTIAEVAQ